jgi:hypothetical protein
MRKKWEVQTKRCRGSETLRRTQGDRVGRLSHSIVIDQNEAIWFETLQGPLQELDCAGIQDDPRPIVPKRERFL